MGVQEPPEDFCQRSLDEGWIPKIGRLTGVIQRSPGVTWFRTRVVSHVQYELKGPGGQLRGEESAENAYHGEVHGDSRWLRAVTPPFNPFADRRTCSEFRFFDRLLDALSRASMASDAVVRAKVEGHITIRINAPPCVSCIGVVRQFQLLFPGVALRISGGRGVPVQVWPRPAAAEEIVEVDASNLHTQNTAESSTTDGHGWQWRREISWNSHDWWWQSSWDQWRT